MTELEEMEEYNRQFNATLSKRPVKNLIVCPECKGSGAYYSTLIDEPQVCMKCCGKKYVPVPNLDEKIRKITDFLVPISSLPKEKIDKFNKVNAFEPIKWEDHLTIY